MKTSPNLIIFDPYCIDGLQEYTNAYCQALVKQEIYPIVIGNYYSDPIHEKVELKNIFFRFSQRMKSSKLRKGIRFIEYLTGWIRVLYYTKKKKAEIFHIMWLIHFKTDIIFLKLLKLLFPHCKLVYTAHNVIPHNNADRHLKELAYIYEKFDKILLHGESLKIQFLNTFHNIRASKIFVTYHGAKTINADFSLEEININLKRTIEKGKKNILFLGLLNENKGVDILYSAWSSIKKPENTLLIIAGKKDSNYEKLLKIESNIKMDNSVIYYPQYLSQAEVNYLFSKSDAVVLPYRNGSVSGVFFNASFFKKPVLTTRFGSISEYIVNNNTSYIVENNTESFADGLNMLVKKSNEELKIIGVNNYHHINKYFHWDILIKDIISNCYQTE